MDEILTNPMISMAKKSMKTEDLEQYKKIGEYMYNNIDYKNNEIGSKPNDPTNINLASYALEAIKAGGDPKDLSENELNALSDIYGEKWYEKYGFVENDIPKNSLNRVSEQIFNYAESQIKKLKLSRKQKRRLERRIKSDKKKLN